MPTSFLFHLPSDLEITNVSPLNVGVVFNQKPTQLQSGRKGDPTSDETDDLPSTGSRGTDPLTITSPPSHRLNDTFAEWDNAVTIEAVRAALAEIHTVTLIEAGEHTLEELAAVHPDVVFNMAEGLHGVSREAQIPSILEFLKIPYTGSDPLTLATCLDKGRTKEILSFHGIPTPRFNVVSRVSELTGGLAKFPYIVKPLHEGSSKGIYNSSVVRNWDALRHEVETTIDTYHQPALVEEYLDGREFTVALLGNGENVHVLPIVEIKFDSLPRGVNPIYSYEAKWIWDQAQSPLDIFECPAEIPADSRYEIESTCRKVFALLRCRDWCRIDVRLDGAGKPHVLELNPLPGILPEPEDNSCFPKAARAAGMSYDRLVQTVLHLAAERSGVLQAVSANRVRVA